MQTSANEAESRVYAFEGFTLDATCRSLRARNGDLDLRPKSFDVLCYLVEHAGVLVRKDEILRKVWAGIHVTDESLARCVSDIRRSLNDREQRIVKTVPGRGYLLAVPVSRVPANGAPAASAGTHPEPAALALPDRPSIAVLPFNNMSADASQAFFSDGITEDITSALCRLKGFFVIARNTAFTYKDLPKDVRVIGRELGVRYVLEGSVRKAGDKIRVTAQLLEAETGNHLWAEHYDRDLADIFAIQDEITASIVGRIGPELLAAEYARASRRAPQNLDAWECVVRALFHSSHQSEHETRTALDLLDRALASDPNYAHALGMKAWILVFRAFQGWEDMERTLGQAIPLIAQAMAADNDELWPHLAQGMVAFATRDNALAVATLTRALAISPNSVNAYGLLGIAHAFGGRSAEAIACIDHAVRLSPRDTFLSDFELYYAFAHFQGARYERALQFAQQAHRMRPGHPYPLLLGAACAGQLGESEIGTRLLGKLRAVLPCLSAPWVEMTSPYVLAADRARLVDGLTRAGLR
jgi:TolB-like protein/Tfp pilus assembly protein PilF